MTITQAIEHLTAALARAKPGCYATVSPQALAVVLAQLNHEGEDDEQPTVQ